MLSSIEEIVDKYVNLFYNIFQEMGDIVKTFQYKFEFKPGIQEYIFREMYFNEKKKEKEILKCLIEGKTCIEIGEEVGYSDKTIQRRRKTLFEKTKDYML